MELQRNERLIRLVHLLHRKGRVTIASALRELGERSGPAQIRSVRDDLNLIADQGFVERDTSEREHVWRLRSFVDETVRGELDRLALEVGKEQLGFLAETPLEPPDVGGPRRWEHLDRKLLVLHEPERLYADHRDALDELVEALLSERPVRFVYEHADGRETARDRAQVLTLVVYRRAVYAILRAEDLSPYCFAVERFRVVEALRKEKVAYPADWSPRRHFRDVFGVIPGKAAERVVLRFARSRERLIRSRVWHPSQQIRLAMDGWVELRMTARGVELERFALEWGEQCEVVEPRWLRRKVIEALRGALHLYGNEAAEPTRPAPPPNEPPRS